MSKKYDNKYENDFYEYKDDTDFSIYDEDLEESVRESRQARREAKKRRRVKAANKVKPTPQETIQEMLPDSKVMTEAEIAADDALAAVNEEEPQDGNIKIKSTRKKRGTKDKNGKKVSVVSATANTPGERPRRKKKGFFRKLISLACVLLVGYAAVIAVTWGLAAYRASQGEPWPELAQSDSPLPVPAPVLPQVPDRTIVLLMVTDEDKTRTDSMVLANYDNVNKKMTLVSIPRDIMVEVTDENFRIMRSEYPEPREDGQVMKMNHIHHFGGENHGVELLLSEIDHQFDIQPDYWVKIDFDGFNYVVDSIGGVEFEVPQDMDYEDPSQDLYIHLKKGTQLLDGDKAEQLVRFRKDNYGGGYVNGDIDRLQVQQAFMKAFMAKALSADVIFKNLTNYMTAFQKYVTTNATISDMARYAAVLKELDMSNVETLTLPCVPSPEYGEYVLSESEAQKMLYNVFKKPLDEVKQDIETEKAEADLEKSTDKNIQVLNGGYTDGMAREIESRFNEKDIPVAAVGTYNEGKPENTVIYTSREGIGLDLVKFFYNGADVVVDPEKTGEYDIVVIVGVNEPMEKGGTVVTSEYEDAESEVVNDTETDYEADYYDDDPDYDEDWDDYDNDDDEDYDYE